MGLPFNPPGGFGRIVGLGLVNGNLAERGERRKASKEEQSSTEWQH